MDVKGFCREGFEPVRDAFAANFDEGKELGASCAVTLNGEPVVDLWAGMADHDRPWIRNTRVHIQSTSKAVTAATAMLLTKAGLLQLGKVIPRWSFIQEADSSIFT